MARQQASVQINQFVAGLVTDASPLTFPENSSAVDINMELNSDGSRQRALGMDYEDLYQTISTTVAGTSDTAVNTYKWENAGGDPEKVIICVQFGNQVKFFDGDSQPLSAGLIGTRNFTSSLSSQRFSFSSVDGNLVIATGINLITVAKYNGSTLSYSTDTIKVRDFFGVQDFDGSTDLTVGAGIQRRPSSLTQAHRYNLRNQGYGVARMVNNEDNVVDPITGFRDSHQAIKGSNKYPSNSDSIAGFLYADASDNNDRNSRRYFAIDNVKNPIGSTPAAKGYFIIDLLNRGSSRITEASRNATTYPELGWNISSLPQDSTTGGATVISEFSGRIWYSGFNGENVNGDDKSPVLSSYIAFSQLVDDPSQITRCYQEGDPTADDAPDILDTDGGYIRLNDAYGISGMVNLGRNLMVIASNGVWRIYGGNDSGFSATNYVVEKITDKGARGPSSIVQIDNTLMYWSDDGIYWVRQNQYGDWSAESMTQNRIQRLYNSISIEDKKGCVATFDGYQRKVRWLYNNHFAIVGEQKELIFDVNLNAFYERHISQLNVGNVPLVMSSFNTNTFKVTEQVELVTVEGVNVTENSNLVTVTEAIRSSDNSLYEIGYVVVTQILPTIQYTFGAYTDPDFIDWKSANGVGVDSPATLVTGTATGGDAMLYKQIPYLYVHMKRTEDGFVGDFVPDNQSSCKIQSRWDWTNSANANKWGPEFEAYRYRRVYMPADIMDDFDTGYELIITKNKLRGRGRSIAFRFSSSPGKEMHIYGWALVMSANRNV